MYERTKLNQVLLTRNLSLLIINGREGRTICHIFVDRKKIGRLAEVTLYIPPRDRSLGVIFIL